ncbi:MAG TPA: hypothetical protein VKA27_09830 [Sunxiuqinia sp.]|nr:hypothetical protein [Sunxiuqinia sp.]
MEKKDKKNIGKNLLKGTLVAGALFSVSSLSAATTSNLFDYNAMGSGATVRSELLSSPTASAMNSYNMSTNASKAQEASCGENKSKDANCGANKKEAKKDKSSKMESKSKDAKCANKAAKADTTKKESKSKEQKCGEGKCAN